ncbi:hypothetical protein [Streptomyces monashensis]|uniref:hypothetical protein n=1 Tax=Streptomyces monashensis TaxID=1678012 RepID=UPI001FE3C1C0|nr:hypothetical protein [Streptomyces monashensis]
MAAQALLEGDAHSVEEVPRPAGFGSSETPCRVFRRRLGVAPARFRTSGTAPG